MFYVLKSEIADNDEDFASIQGGNGDNEVPDEDYEMAEASKSPASVSSSVLAEPVPAVATSSAPAPSPTPKKRKARGHIGEYAKLKGGEMDIAMYHLIAKGYTKEDAAAAATVKKIILQTHDMRYRTTGGDGTPKKRGPQPKQMITSEMKRDICEYLDCHSVVTAHQVRTPGRDNFRPICNILSSDKHV